MAQADRSPAAPAPATAPQRDEQSLRAELAESAPAVRRFLLAMCGDWHLSEELAQDALLKAWAARAGFAGRSGVGTWLFAIARNRWLDHVRSVGRREAAKPDASARPREPQPHVAAERAELAAAVRRAMDALPAEQREVLALRESGSLTFAQIAAMLGLPAATVKSRARYALLKLADELAPFRLELQS